MSIEICAQLSKIQSLNVILIYLENLNYYENQTKNLKIKLIESTVYPSLTSKNKIQVSALKEFIENFKPDIIHTHLFKAEIVSRYCFYNKAKWFTHTHDNMVQLQNWSWKSIFKKISITNFYEKKLLFNLYKKNGGTHFIAISKHSESYIKSVQSKYPVTLLHNAIDVKRFQKPADFQKRIENGGLSIIEGNHSPLTTHQSPVNINIINIGSFLKNKNQRFLMDIVKEIKNRGKKVQCIFLGDGPYLEEVKRKSITLGVEKECQFLGNVEKVEEYLWNADVYVHVSMKEAFGLTLVEAMAAGLPVITLDGGGNRDIMINGKNGYLIQKQDPKEFTDRILEVCQNNEISNFNTEFAKQFDIESYCDNLINLYNN
jgi:glycosyltransferase involved in cell wall biosynthesis